MNISRPLYKLFLRLDVGLLIGICAVLLVARDALLKEQRGAETALVCRSLNEFVTKERRWPTDWEELAIEPHDRSSYMKNVRLCFDLELNDVLTMLKAGEDVVHPNGRATGAYISSLENLQRAVERVIREDKHNK